VAKSGNGGGDSNSWPGFLSELSKGFLILRDIFGYAFPGAVFLAIGALNKDFSLQNFHDKFLSLLPTWIVVTVGLAACYAIGHVLSAIAYFFFNTWKWPLGQGKHTSAKQPSKSGPTLSSPELILARERHPELMAEAERQSVMTQLRGSTGVAMVLGPLVFGPFRSNISYSYWMLILAGLFQWVVFFFSAMPHVNDLKANTVRAAELSDQADRGEEQPNPDEAEQEIIAVGTETREET